MTTNIYVLKLEGGRYYVGKTDNVMKRYEQHVGGCGSAWTKKYRPISIEKTIKNASPFDEDKVTKEYMAKYGIDRVRGGSYCEIELSEFHKKVLKMEIWSAKDLCTGCGRSGHWVKDCYASKDITESKIEYEEIESISKNNVSQEKSKRTSFTRLSNSHPEHYPEKEVLWIIRTYIESRIKMAKTSADMPIGTKYLPYAESLKEALKDEFNNLQFDILHKTDSLIMIRCSWIDEWGCEYCDRTFTTEYGCGVHEGSCKKKNTKNSYVKQTSKKEGACYRCGRQGHYVTDCYASTHSKGYSLDSDCESDEDSD